MNKKKLDEILIVDIEATCWERPKDQPPGEFNEIIEIGIVKFSLKNLTFDKPTSILIKPEKSKISSFCTKITTLTQEVVDTGISFRMACEQMVKELKSNEIPWYSWGDYDKNQFLRQCREDQVGYPFGAGHTNFRNIFSVMMGLPRELGLVNALKHLNMEFEGTHHRGGDDVHNIARVVAHCYGKVRA